MSSPAPPAPEDPEGLAPGRATTTGTRRYADRCGAHADHFSRPDELWLPSVGLGTLRGDPGGVDDLLFAGDDVLSTLSRALRALEERS